MIENDEKWVRNFLVENLLVNEKLVKDYCQDKSFVLKDVSIEYMNTKDTFMLTQCYTVKINFEYNGKDYFNSLVVKKSPDITEDAYEAVNFDTLFHNEITAYTEIMPALGCSVNYPKYFYSHRKKLEAVLVLGDFTIDGWMMAKSRVNLSLEHILLSVKLIAEFHGKGLAFKKNNPEKFQTLVSTLREGRYASIPPPHWRIVLSRSTERSFKAAREYKPNIPENFLNKLENLISDIYEYGKKRVKPIEPLATICHGDFLRNNVAFKYSAEDIPVEAMLFDFQTLRYSSPMLDLAIFMSLSSGSSLRSAHFNQIFNAYWNELVSSYCNQAKISVRDLPKYLSYGNLLNDYILHLPFGIATASTFLMNLWEPDGRTAAEVLELDGTPEEYLQDVFERGGKTVDMELAGLVDDLYNFSVKYNCNIFEKEL